MKMIGKDGWKSPRSLSCLRKPLQVCQGILDLKLAIGSLVSSRSQPAVVPIRAMLSLLQGAALGPLVSSSPGSQRSAGHMLIATTYTVVLESMGFVVWTI